MAGDRASDTRERIREAAVRVFSRDGFDRSSVKAIAEEAGVAVGTIYLHFENKDDLLISVFEEEFNARLIHLDEMLEDRAAAPAQIQTLLETHFERVRAYPELAELLLYERFHRGSRLRERILPLQQRILKRIARILEDGIDDGWIRPCNPKVVALALFDLVQTMTACWALADPADADEIASAAPRELTDLMWKGLAAKGDGRV